MICKHCHTELPDGAAFCSHCGQSTAEAVQPAVNEQPVAPAVPETPAVEVPAVTHMAQPQEAAPKAKKKGPKVILALVAVVAVVAIAVSCLLGGAVTNLLVNLGSEKDHLAYVYSNMAKNAGNGVNELYSNAATAYENDRKTASGKLELEVSESLLKLLAGSGVDEALGDIDTVSFAYAVSAEEANKAAMSLLLNLQKKELVRADVSLDIDSGDLLLAVPVLTEKTLKVNLYSDLGLPRDLFTPTDFVVLSQIESANAVMSEYGEDLLVKLFPSLLDVALDAIDVVERDKETFTANGVSQKATCLTVEVTKDTLHAMSLAVLEELKSNKDIRAMLLDVYKEIEELAKSLDADDFDFASADAFYESYQEAIDELIGELDELKGDEVLLTLKTWVSASNDILAVSAEDIAGPDTGLFIGKATDGKTVGYEISATEGNVALFCVMGEGTEKGDTFTGEFRVAVDGEEFLTLECEALNTKKLADGQFDGTVTLSASKALVDQLDQPMLALGKLKISGKTTDKSVNLELSVVMESSPFVTLRMQTEIGGKVDIEIDDKKTESDPNDWIGTFDFGELADRLKEAGVPAQYADMLGALDADSMMGSGSSEL